MDCRSFSKPHIRAFQHIFSRLISLTDLAININERPHCLGLAYDFVTLRKHNPNTSSPSLRRDKEGIFYTLLVGSSQSSELLIFLPCVAENSIRTMYSTTPVPMAIVIAASQTYEVSQHAYRDLSITQQLHILEPQLLP